MVMQISHITIFISFLSKKKDKLISIDQLKVFAQQSISTGYNEQKCYKLILWAKTRWYLRSVTKVLFIICSPDQPINDIQYEQLYYHQLMYSRVTQDCGKRRYVWWIKWLQLHIGDFSFPDTLAIYSPTTSTAATLINNKKIMYKCMMAEDPDKWRKVIKSHIQTCYRGTKKIYLGSVELCLIEALYSPSIHSRSEIESLVKKIVKKIKKTYTIHVYQSLLKIWKYHSSITRLCEISTYINTDLHNDLLKLLKKYSHPLLWKV